MSWNVVGYLGRPLRITGRMQWYVVKRCKSLEPWASAEECVPAKNKMQAGTLSCLGADFLPVICTDYTLANTSNSNTGDDKQISHLGKEGIWEREEAKVEEKEGEWEGETERFEKKSKEGNWRSRGGGVSGEGGDAAQVAPGNISPLSTSSTSTSTSSLLLTFYSTSCL